MFRPIRRARPSWFVSAAAGAGVLACLYLSGSASAKANYDSPYGFERTWNAGLRLVRVELGLKVVEKDDGAGYVLFDYTSPESGRKPVPGSMELVRGKDGTVRVVVQITQMPAYHEQVFIDALVRKLRNEYGDAPRTPPPSVKDAGPEAGEP